MVAKIVLEARVKRWLKITLIVLGAVVCAALLAFAFLLLPIGDADLRSRPDPAGSYAEAMKRIDAELARENTLPLQSITHSVALVHGSQTTTAVVIFHGYTHGPYQWRVIDKAYYDAGYNVWVPLAPFHGYADRMTTDLSKLTPEILRQYADANVDIGRGLGKNVEVVGLSAGGDAAVWAAAARPDVTRAVAIAPMMSPPGVPSWLLMPGARLLRYTPDIRYWWQPSLKEKAPGPAYPRYSVRGVFAAVQLTQWALAQARAAGGPIARGKVELLANFGDHAIDVPFNVAAIKQLVPTDRLTIFTIPASRGFGHDLIEPENENKAVMDQVYPLLEEALGIPIRATDASSAATGTP